MTKINRRSISIIKFVAFFVFCVFLGLSSLTAENNPGLRRFGIFIGANDGGGDRVLLEYATTDARAMIKVMEEMGGIEPGDSMLLRNPDRRSINRSFARLRASINDARSKSRRVEFLLYYSGHSDETGILLSDERFEYRELRDNIINMGADVNIAILDSCSSGAFTRLKGGTRQTPFLFDESVTTKGHAFLTSSSEDEAAQESDAIGGSFFTHYLVSALRGAADSTRDGRVTLNEAYDYAFNETLSRTSATLAGPQHPAHEISLTGSGELVLTDLRVASAGLVIAEDLSGRFFIKDTSGRMVAEVRKEPGIALTLALPAGSYTMTVENNSELLQTTVILTTDEMSRVSQHQLRAISPEITTTRGNDSGLEEDPDAELKESVRGLGEAVAEVGADLTFVGGVATGYIMPSPFLCLTLKVRNCR